MSVQVKLPGYPACIEHFSCEELASIDLTMNPWLVEPILSASLSYHQIHHKIQRSRIDKGFWQESFNKGKEDAKSNNECHTQVSTYFGPWIKMARSLVIFPVSTVSMHDASNLWTKSSNLSFWSNLALKSVKSSDFRFWGNFRKKIFFFLFGRVEKEELARYFSSCKLSFQKIQ